MATIRQTFQSTCDRSVGFALIVAATAAFLALISGTAATAQDCFHGQCTYSECHTPARSAPSQLWGELAPTDGGQLPSSRDNTGFDQVGDFETNPYTMALDVESDFVFVVANRRFQVWDARSNPGNPTRVFNQGFRSSGLTWTPDAHAFFIFEDIDAPPNDPNVVALAGIYGVGTAIYDTSTKDNPLLKYQHHGGGFWAKGVYATTLGATDYVFSAVDQVGATPGGLFAYNMSAAKSLTGRCDETIGGTVCPGVFVRKIGTRNRVQSVDGAGNFVAIASGISPRGFEIWNVSNPASPTRVMEGLTGDAVYGLAMWRQGSSHYLAVRTQTQGRIYNVSCITGGSCAPGGAIWSMNLPSSSAGSVTFSTSSSTPFLYFGAEGDCQGGNQNEWLFNVTNPSSPSDITPQGTVIINGEPVSYWGWYYRQNGVHGFNRVAPRMGKFHEDHFYRAGYSIFDIHRRTSGSPPTANFSYSPAQVYPGTQVDFTDQSTGAPSAWDWDFQDGNPSGSTAQNPQNVQFSLPLGSKTVSLQVTNAAGTDTTSQTLQLLNPIPAVGSVSASPNPALLCQPVTFTAQSVTGRPPTTFAWQVRQVGGATVATGGNQNPFIWTSDPGDTTGVSYQAEVTVSNADGSASATSANVTLNALPALPASNTFAPTYVGQPNNPPTGTVEFNVAVAGATEWNWNFGDNPGGGPNNDGYEGWTSNPVTGPNPTHSYTVVGTYNVRVKVRNCVESERESSPVSVNITSITPLVANFQATGIFCQSGGCFATVGVPVTFVDSSTGPPEFWDYDWDGNGSYEQANNTSPVTSHTFTSVGTVIPKLRVRQGAQSDIDTHLPIIVETGGGGGNASIAVTGPSTGSINQILTYNASASGCTPAPTGWSWTTSSGTISGPSNGASINVSWSAAGTKVVRAENTACGNAQGSRSVTITGGGGGGGGNGGLDAVFTFQPAAPKAGETISFDGSSSLGSPTIFTWDFGDGGSASGAQVSHSYSVPGSYSVTLEVSKQNSSCDFGICLDELTRTVVVSNSGPPPLTARFTVNASCFGASGAELCDTEVGEELLFTDTSIGGVTSRSWDFGDGTTSTAVAPTHTFTAPGTFVVTLTVSNADDSDEARKTFNVEGEPPPEPPDTVLLPWVAQSDGALDQVSALYVHNPDSQAREVTLRFFERRAPSSTDPAPEMAVTLAAGETAYFPNVLGDQFQVSNVSGFIEIEVDGEDALAPTAVSYHRTFNPNGLTFGHAVPAETAAGFPRSVTGSLNETFHLMGLNDNDSRLAFFGITNPGEKAARFQLRFFNQLGEEIGITPDPMSIGPKNNRQFQVETLRQTFGVEEASDYRIEIEILNNGPVFIYGANLRLPALDPSYVRPGDPTSGKVYLLGVLATQGLNNTQWQTDAVLANVVDTLATARITFTSAGNGAEPSEPILQTLLARETLRLSNILADHFDLDADSSLGFVTIESDEAGGAHPIVQAETYDVANPNGRFGQFMPALRDDQAAVAGQRQILTGLQQDASSRSTLWLLNPGEVAGEYDLIYRSLGGSEIGRLSAFRVAAGSMRQINPGAHPLVDGTVEGGFTVQIVVRRGSVLSAAQVVNSITNDPAFVAGVTR